MIILKVYLAILLLAIVLGSLGIDMNYKDRVIFALTFLPVVAYLVLTW